MSLVLNIYDFLVQSTAKLRTAKRGLQAKRSGWDGAKLKVSGGEQPPTRRQQNIKLG